MERIVEPIYLDLSTSGPIQGREVCNLLMAKAKEVAHRSKDLIKVSFRSDLKLWASDRLKRSLAPEQVESLSAPALAGGAYSKESLPTRLIKLDPTLAGEELAQLCCEIMALVSKRKSILDSVRQTESSVTRVFKEVKNEQADLGSSDNPIFLSLETERKKLENRKIGSFEELNEWIDDAVDFFRKISEVRQKQITENEDLDINESAELISAKKSKGFVSTKSIDTYEKRVRDFSGEFVQVNNRKINVSQLIISNSINPYLGYTASEATIKNGIDLYFSEHLKKQFLKNLQETQKKIKEGEIQELEHFSGNRSFKITYFPQISSNSIDQVLHSLRAQLNSKRSDGKATHRIGSAFLTVEIPGLKKGDIEEIEAVLRSS